MLTAKLSVIRDGFELSCRRNIDRRRQHKRVSFPKIKSLKVLLETNPRRGHDRSIIELLYINIVSDVRRVEFHKTNGRTLL